MMDNINKIDVKLLSREQLEKLANLILDKQELSKLLKEAITEKKIKEI